MPIYIEFTQKTPDAMIEEALAGKHVVKERLSDFCTWLQDERKKKFNASVHGSYHIIRGFYSHNDINTQKIRTPKVDPSEVQFSDDRVPLFDIVNVDRDGKKVKDKQIRREFLKSFFECLSPRDKLIALCIKDSGLDSGDILDLPLSILRYQDPNNERIFIRMTRAKTSEIVSTFFSKETSKMIKNYERMNRTGALDTETIFVQSKKEFKIDFNKKHGRVFDPEVDNMILEKIDSHSLSRNFRNAVIQLEKMLGSEQKILQYGKQSPLRPKRFRKLFNDACDIVGVPTDVKRVFMGKSDPSNKTYEGKSRQDLEIYYEMVEPKLLVYTEYEDGISQETEELKREIAELKKQQADENARRDQALEYLMRKERERETNSTSD